MRPSTPATDFTAAQRCPLCGNDNRCAMETQRATGVKQPPCWCTQAHFSTELQARIPTAARDKTCLCEGCTSAATPANSPHGTIQR